MKNYIGIDYGNGRSNIDNATGIRYGVISCNSMGEGFYDQQEFDYGNATCPDCGNDLIDSHDATVTDEDWNDGKDYACAECKLCVWSDNAFSDEPCGWSIEDSDYTVSNCLDNDAIVIKSPYYTHAQFCSPCVPGACSLDSPITGNPVNGFDEPITAPKAYCFGHDWFDGGKAPYPVYSVASGCEVIAEEQITPCPNCTGTGMDTVARVANVREVTTEHVRELILNGEINVRDFDPATDKFLCFRCSGTGNETAMIQREVAA